MRFVGSLLVAATLALPAAAAPKERSLKELEDHVKELTKGAKGNDAHKQLEAFMKWLQVPMTCPECKEIASAKWLTENLDSDAEDERILAITAVGSGACPAARLEVIVFDAAGKNWTVAGHASLGVAGAKKPIAEVAAMHVHALASKDVVMRLDGECDGAREHEVRVHALDNNKLVEIASSAEHVGKELVSHKIVGSPPATIELATAKSKTKLYYDEDTRAYDPLAPYDVAIKSNIAKDDDTTLSMKDCTSPLSTTMVSDCGLTGSAKIQVVVQDGQAIGLTVSVTPGSTQFVRCVRKAVAHASWKRAPGAIGCSKTFTIK